MDVIVVLIFSAIIAYMYFVMKMYVKSKEDEDKIDEEIKILESNDKKENRSLILERRGYEDLETSPYEDIDGINRYSKLRSLSNKLYHGFNFVRYFEESAEDYHDETNDRYVIDMEQSTNPEKQLFNIGVGVKNTVENIFKRTLEDISKHNKSKSGKYIVEELLNNGYSAYCSFIIVYKTTSIEVEYSSSEANMISLLNFMQSHGNDILTIEVNIVSKSGDLIFTYGERFNYKFENKS